MDNPLDARWRRDQLAVLAAASALAVMLKSPVFKLLQIT